MSLKSESGVVYIIFVVPVYFGIGYLLFDWLGMYEARSFFWNVIGTFFWPLLILMPLAPVYIGLAYLIWGREG